MLPDKTGNTCWDQREKGIYSFEVLVAERKAFFSRKRLVYSAQFRIDEGNREVRFTEMLKESGSGLSSGGIDREMSARFGFKKESCNTFSRAREGTIEEQSTLFRKKCDSKFDFGAIRSKFETKAQKLDIDLPARLPASLYRLASWNPGRK